MPHEGLAGQGHVLQRAQEMCTGRLLDGTIVHGILQAMNRAHRLGQRRALSVYRLLVRGTLEERTMGLRPQDTAAVDKLIARRRPWIARTGWASGAR